ncbi:lipid asymmetry maintenance protein MlaB, partial [Polynucleobacter sp. UK-Kesae-W10]|uniref:STAS domain-containing protein n=1 Tax=Polynucleobacter sp. UK-Kesae-W10 TaxID=1819738 RepID=UPI0021029EB2
MSISDAISSVSTDSNVPVAVWSQIDATHAKISLNGIVNVYTLGGVWTQIRDSQNAWLAQLSDASVKTAILTFDASNVASLDGAGIAFLIGIEEAQQKVGAQFSLVGLDQRYQPLLHEFDPITNLFPAPVVKPKRSFVVSTGMATQNLIDDTKGLITFTGHLAADLFWSL